jgi:tetratricopeptide (TPR) repeat protein
MQPAPRPGFLDVPALLAASEPRARFPRMGFLALGFVVVVAASALMSSQSEAARNAVRVLSALLMVGLMAGLSAMTMVLVRRFRAEQQLIEAAGEAVQLRRWPEAGAILEQYLSRPARTHQLRAQALIFLASVLARYHRYDDAIAVYDELLGHELVDPASAFGLRLGRAMALLADDHLFDADRAISELKRAAGDKNSAGLALLELYRDVKTGHSEDAVERCNQTLPVMRDELGHRVADAYALVARAYDLLGRAVEAQDAFDRATLLAPPPELYRRYPEVQKLEGRYRPAHAPPEAA